MLDGLSARELIWWKALYTIEGEEREEERERAMRAQSRRR